MTTTWLEHATFWFGIKRAAIALRSPWRLLLSVLNFNKLEKYINLFYIYDLPFSNLWGLCSYENNCFNNLLCAIRYSYCNPEMQGLRSAMAARLIPNQKVACSSHVVVNVFDILKFISLKLICVFVNVCLLGWNGFKK